MSLLLLFGGPLELPPAPGMPGFGDGAAGINALTGRFVDIDMIAGRAAPIHALGNRVDNSSDIAASAVGIDTGGRGRKAGIS